MAIIRRKRVYLAGPGVFRINAEAFGAELKTICNRYGLDAIWPLDAVAGDAPAIFAANVDAIRSADVIAADLSPFRGPHMDCGTAWECGFAHALGLQVFAWSSHNFELMARIPRAEGDNVEPRDLAGMLIEDFLLPENLMIAVPARRIYSTAEQAISAAATYITRQLPVRA